jgi:23S rRNA (cytosine1962-C5)-methyltransferase
MNTKIFTTTPQKEYALIDSGDGMKLERYGNVVIARPDPQVLWRKSLPEKEWMKVDAYFSKDSERVRGDEEERGKWVISRPGLPEIWPISFGDLIMNIKLTPFKHTGLFPEQHNNWMWCRDLIKKEVKEGRKPTVLNLFGYTGGASLSAALGGAEVTHVDASRVAVTWANDNAKSSGLSEAPIRWMLDDAYAFVKRELRREKKYDAIIMDPPAFGRGAKGEIWKIEEHFLPLFEDCLKLLSDTPLFVVLNGYAAGYSPIAYENNLKSIIERFGGEVESGELALQEEGPQKRLLPCGIVSRWKRS